MSFIGKILVIFMSTLGQVFSQIPKSNVTVGVIYRHASIGLTDFNWNYVNPLLDNISTEQKSIFLHGDFIVNLQS